jgi:hypothetical protein
MLSDQDSPQPAHVCPSHGKIMRSIYNSIRTKSTAHLLSTSFSSIHIVGHYHRLDGRFPTSTRLGLSLPLGFLRLETFLDDGLQVFPDGLTQLVDLVLGNVRPASRHITPIRSSISLVHFPCNTSPRMVRITHA